MDPACKEYRYKYTTTDGKRTYPTVAALVMEMFHPTPRPPNAIIKHENGEKLDNYYGNLSYVKRGLDLTNV